MSHTPATTVTTDGELQDELAGLRRDLHADPEIGLELPRTQRRVLDALSGLPLEVSTGRALSSVTAVLRGGRPGRSVLLRADMDALPLTEQADLPYASRNDGAMHACGHDLHTAALVGAARVLCARREQLAGDVVFMFQPGEEGCDGAGKMIEEGVLEAAGAAPVAAYAMHVASAGIPRGLLAGRPGPILAGGDLLKAVLRGMGGHGSAPHLTRDPLPAACAVVGALQTLITHTVDPFDSAVLTIGAIHSGTAGNIIPATAELEGSLRWFSPQARDALREGFERVCRSIAAAHGVEAETQIIEAVRATVNDATEADFAAGVATDLLGATRYLNLPHPLTAGEDFSRILEKVPGAFVMIGVAPQGVDPATAEANHSAYAVFDDAFLADSARYLAELATRRLALA